jgi:3-deoxy-D-manno-octulosonate 8-phosphate phosphatase (KDO 8-P phosphatase)
MSIARSQTPNAECRWPADDCRKLIADRRQPLADRCAKIRMLVIDVDGVLTDGRVIYSDNGVETKAFHVRDGTGLKIWQQQGLGVAIITGRTSRAVQIRAAELGISTVVQGAADKLSACRRSLDDSGLCFDQVCAIGDDLPDLPVLCNCALAVAVADACPEVRSAAHYVTRTPGGRGAVREVIELILSCQGRWPAGAMKNER